MRLLGNVLWLVFGGLMMALTWCVYGLLACITIVGLPWARSCFMIARFTLLPFGHEAMRRDELTQEEDLGTGTLGLVGNVIWFIFAGVWLAIGHLAWAVILFFTIIGIPFSIQHLKLAIASLFPVGRSVVTVEVAEAARRQNAERLVKSKRQ